MLVGLGGAKHVYDMQLRRQHKDWHGIFWRVAGGDTLTPVFQQLAEIEPSRRHLGGDEGAQRDQHQCLNQKPISPSGDSMSAAGPEGR